MNLAQIWIKLKALPVTSHQSPVTSNQ